MASGASAARRSSTSTPRAGAQSFFLFRGERSIVVPRLLFVLAVLARTVIGLVMVYSASTIEAISEGSDPASYMVKQAAILAVSIGLCLAIALAIPYYKWLGRALDVFWVFSMLLLLATAFIGTAALGAQRWLVIGPISFQPSEIAKVAFVLTAARIWYKYETEEFTPGWLLGRAVFFVVLPLGFLYASQSDLGTSIICAVGIVAVLWLGGFPAKVLIGVIGALVALGLVAVLGTGYRTSRLSFMNPWADPYGSGYQLIHSFYAFGQGGLFGVGLGNSTEKYLYLPEAETDFIFAIIGEELGLVGALAVVALFIVLLYGGLQIARKAPDSFGTMIAGGCVIMLVFQAFLNIGCVIGVLPTTGKPLPFISSGGSSLLGSYLLVAIILSVSLASGEDSGVYEARRDALRVVRDNRPSGARANAGRPRVHPDAASRGFSVIGGRNSSRSKRLSSNRSLAMRASSENIAGSRSGSNRGRTSSTRSRADSANRSGRTNYVGRPSARAGRPSYDRERASRSSSRGPSRTRRERSSGDTGYRQAGRSGTRGGASARSSRGGGNGRRRRS